MCRLQSLLLVMTTFPSSVNFFLFPLSQGSTKQVTGSKQNFCSQQNRINYTIEGFCFPWLKQQTVKGTYHCTLTNKVTKNSKKITHVHSVLFHMRIEL
jgi:hypothetical protein